MDDPVTLVRPVRSFIKHVGGRACQAVTPLSERVAEMFAREPDFYDKAICAKCKISLPISQFVWCSETGVARPPITVGT